MSYPFSRPALRLISFPFNELIKEDAAWSSAGAGSPAMPARRRKPQTMVLFDAVQRRAGLLDFKQPPQPPWRGYSDAIVGPGRYLALR